VRAFGQDHRRCRPLLTLILAVTALGVAGSASGEARRKQVLVLYPTRPDGQIAIVGERELPRILDRAFPEGVDYYSEYLDRLRIPDSTYETPFRDFLRLKYSQQRFDLVMAIDDPAVEFVERFRDDVFPASPVVFFATSPRSVRLPDSTGIVAHLDYSRSLQLAVTLQPDVRHLFVVTDGSGPRESKLLQDAREQFQRFAGRLTIEYVPTPPAQELPRRFGALPPGSVIYYLSVSRDAIGDNFHPLEYLDRLASVANAPIYCWVDSAMNHGIVGGDLKHQDNEMRALGELALRVLRGERADAIPVASPDLTVREVDRRQLRRWGISEARVPAGTSIRFREPSAWERYRVYILGALAILLAQSALIMGLLVQKSRRQRAETRLLVKEADLRTSYERIRQLAGRLLTAQETERSRIARELHDDIVQKLAILEIELTSAERTSREHSIDEARERIRDLAVSVRDLSHQLHPPNLRLIGLVLALEGLQKEVSRPGVTISFVHDDVLPPLSLDLTLCLFRIAQESLHNALKYSNARQITLELRCASDTVSLMTTDDGIGFDVDAAWDKGLGLMSMVERLEAFGGRLEVQSRPGVATRVHATVPLSAAVRLQPAFA
jgi:signal transduction histidine kinase